MEMDNKICLDNEILRCCSVCDSINYDGKWHNASKEMINFLNEQKKLTHGYCSPECLIKHLGSYLTKEEAEDIFKN
ncbi:MAG: hypothetical protein WC307_01105 [Candidatus Nanoarchaeia archaeon]|jgi:hypothetical protein